MEPRFHMPGLEKFGYSIEKRYLFSFYVYMNSVLKIKQRYSDRYSDVFSIKGYAAHFCMIRLQSFLTFINVVLRNKDYVSANCLLRMLGDSVAVFKLVYMEPDLNYRIIRHSLYVLDGCDENLKVLEENSIKEGHLSEEERKKANLLIKESREHRNKLKSEIQGFLDHSPLKKKDELAFSRIVEDKNWKFKEFKNYNKKEIIKNQFKWKELYEKIDYVEDDGKYSLLSYLSQYAHGLSMSNLLIELDEQNCDDIIGVALGLLDKMNGYILDFYPEDLLYINKGLLEPGTRDKLLGCFDEKHRPSIAEWNRMFNKDLIDKKK